MRTTVRDETRHFDPQTRAYAEYRVFSQLAGDGVSPRDVTVTLTRLDANGSTDRAALCTIAVTLESGDVAQVQARGRHPYAAIDRAAALIASLGRRKAPGPAEDSTANAMTAEDC